MRYIFPFYVSIFVWDGLNEALAAKQKQQLPSFLQPYNGDDNQQVASLRGDIESVSTSMMLLSNDTKPMPDMTLSERAELSEMLYDHYKSAMLLINDIPLDDFPQFESIMKVVNQNDKSSRGAIDDSVRRLHSIATTKTKAQRRYSGKRKNESDRNNFQGFDGSDSKDEDAWRQSRDYHRRANKKARFNSGKSQNMYSNHHHEKMLHLHNAILKGDHKFIQNHLFGEHLHGGSSSRSSYGGTPRGRRLAKEARRLASKNDKCKILAQCAKRMSLYDLFVYFYSDDIDPVTGEIDDNVMQLFDDEDLLVKRNNIKTKYEDVLNSNQYGSCNALLAMFHRTVEMDGIPQWEGATISQVCLAEGTTVHVDLGAAAATVLPKPNKNFCPQNKHSVIQGDGSSLRLSVNDGDRHAVRCCANRQISSEWSKYGSCPVWGASYIDGVCYSGKTWKQAKAICNSVGARLCSVEEVKKGCAKSSGCGYDGQTIKLDDCADNGFKENYSGRFIGCGENNRCGNSNKLKSYQYSRRAARCCLDRDGGSSWKKRCNDNRSVWSNSKIDSKCIRDKTWHEADAACKAKDGARICTIEELNNNCANGSDCDLDDDMVWSSTPTWSVGVSNMATTLSNNIVTYMNNLVIPAFIKQPLFCARDLFFSDNRKNDNKYSSEKFVFGNNNADPGRDIMKYRIPTGLLTTDSSKRTVHGQLKNNINPAFTFVTLQHLLDNFNYCVQEAKNAMTSTVYKKYGNQNTVPDSVLISYIEKGMDEYMEIIVEDCITDLFSTITFGLKLVFGENFSPGFICGVTDAVVNDGLSLPGRCCLDAPFNLNPGNWGYKYDCNTGCRNTAPYFAGLDEDACHAQGGTWCANQADCTTLRDCMADLKTFAQSKNKPAFEDYLNRAPVISNPNDSDQCGKTREYFGFDKNYVNDNQVCEDVEQLAYSRDFDFLDEFFGQGSSGGGVTTGDSTDPSNPAVPPLVLQEVNTDVSDSQPVQDGLSWRATNFALEQSWETWEFAYQQLEGAYCGCDPTCSTTIACDLIKWLFETITLAIAFTLGKILAVSAFTMGEVAEISNLEPIWTWENTDAIFDNMDLTGKWLQDRFEDLGTYFEGETDVLNAKLDTIISNQQTLSSRRGLYETSIPPAGLSIEAPALDDESNPKQPPCLNVDIQMEINQSSQLRSIVCHFKCAEGGFLINPDELVVKGIDATMKETFLISTHVTHQLDDGIFVIDIPNNVNVNMFVVKAIVKSSNKDKESVNQMLVSFPVQAELWFPFSTIHNYLFG